MNKQKVNMTSSTKEKGYSSSSHYRISSEFEQSEQSWKQNLIDESELANATEPKFHGKNEFRDVLQRN